MTYILEIKGDYELSDAEYDLYLELEAESNVDSAALVLAQEILGYSGLVVQGATCRNV